MVWFGLRQHPSEASVKVSSRSNLFWLFYRRFSVGLVWYSMVWYSMVWFGWVWFGWVWSGLRQHPSEASVKVSSRSDLFWQFQRRFSVGLVCWYGLA